MKHKTKVLIVDDSAFIRTMFSEMLSSDPSIEVIGVANDPFDAREKIKLLNPDVITLDVEMPKMDGISFLEKIMTLRPMPVIMVSTLTQHGTDQTLKALEYGAFDYIGKPTNHLNQTAILTLKDSLIEKVLAASTSKVIKFSDYQNDNTVISINSKAVNVNKLIAIGSSTGGVEALKIILTKLPNNLPPIIITQHMPEKFTASLASRLNDCCEPTIHEAKDDQKLEVGNVYIAPGNKHLTIKRQGSHYHCKLNDGEKVTGHKPSVDVMFESACQNFGSNCIGLILTGMGKDGANGMLKIKQNGGYTLGQNQDSCVVYGMPKAAKEIGAIDKELSLSNIAMELIKASCR